MKTRLFMVLGIMSLVLVIGQTMKVAELPEAGPFFL